jgi:uncharacterized protein (UPF0332 family)
MGKVLSPEFQKLLQDRKLTKFRPDKKLALKEISAAKSDLKDAKESLNRKKFKWATIQGYYSTFHSARAVLFDKGYREKSHYALLVAIRELCPNEIGQSLIREFEHGMYLRQEADYGLKFSRDGALNALDTASKLLERAVVILKIK